MFKNDFNAEASIRFWAKFTRICVLIISIICAFLTPLLFASDFRSIGQTALAIGVGAFLLGFPISALMWGFADLVGNSNSAKTSSKSAKVTNETPANSGRTEKPSGVSSYTNPIRENLIRNNPKPATNVFEETPKEPPKKPTTPLYYLTIPDRTRQIEHYAYYKCTTLKEVTIPKSVLSIGDKAFCQCTDLRLIVFEGTVSAWNDLVCKGRDWRTGVPATEVICSDGTVKLD